jgi:hypothetical protein
MSYDAYDVWDTIYHIMCIPCQYHNYCHGTEDETNDLQMIICMERGQIVRLQVQVIQKEQIVDPIGVKS